MARVKDYFSLFYIFVLEALINLELLQFKVSKKLKYACICLICFAGYIRYLYVFDDGGLLPYNSYINDNVDIIEIGDK